MVIELPVIDGGKEIGRINVDTGEIFPNADMAINWSCCLDGFCCKRFHIPVTDFDICSRMPQFLHRMVFPEMRRAILLAG